MIGNGVLDSIPQRCCSRTSALPHPSLVPRYFRRFRPLVRKPWSRQWPRPFPNQRRGCLRSAGSGWLARRCAANRNAWRDPEARSSAMSDFRVTSLPPEDARTFQPRRPRLGSPRRPYGKPGATLIRRPPEPRHHCPAYASRRRRERCAHTRRRPPSAVPSPRIRPSPSKCALDAAMSWRALVEATVRCVRSLGTLLWAALADRENGHSASDCGPIRSRRPL